MAEDLHLATALHVDFVLALTMQANERYVPVRVPPDGRCDRVAHSVQLASARPGSIVADSPGGPLAPVSAVGPCRHHYVEAAIEQGSRKVWVVHDAVVCPQLAWIQRADLDRAIMGGGWGEGGTGPPH